MPELKKPILKPLERPPARIPVTQVNERYEVKDGRNYRVRVLESWEEIKKEDLQKEIDAIETQLSVKKEAIKNL